MRQQLVTGVVVRNQSPDYQSTWLTTWSICTSGGQRENNVIW